MLGCWPFQALATTSMIIIMMMMMITIFWQAMAMMIMGRGSPHVGLLALSSFGNNFDDHYYDDDDDNNILASHGNDDNGKGQPAACWVVGPFKLWQRPPLRS